MFKYIDVFVLMFWKFDFFEKIFTEIQRVISVYDIGRTRLSVKIVFLPICCVFFFFTNIPSTAILGWRGTSIINVQFAWQNVHNIFLSTKSFERPRVLISFFFCFLRLSSEVKLTEKPLPKRGPVINQMATRRSQVN